MTYNNFHGSGIRPRCRESCRKYHIKSDIYDISKKSPKIYYESITNIPKIFPNFKNLLSNYFLFVKSGSILYTVYRSIGYSFIYPAIFYRPVGAFLISLIDITNGFQKIPERLAAKLRRYKEINPDLYKRHYEQIKKNP